MKKIVDNNKDIKRLYDFTTDMITAQDFRLGRETTDYDRAYNEGYKQAMITMQSGLRKLVRW